MSDFQQELEKRIQAIQLSATDQETAIQKLQKDFLDARKSGIYNYLVSIPALSIFKYFAIFLVSFTILNAISFTGKHITVLILSILVVFLLNEKRKSTSITRMQEIELKLNSIFPQPKFFYLDAGIVELIYSIREFKTYNSQAYNKLIRILDDFLEITLDIENNPQNSFSLYDILEKMKESALNNLQSIIYNTPSDLVAENKLDNATKSLHFILNFHLEQIRIIANDLYEKDGPTIKNKYIYSNESSKPHDEFRDGNFDLY